MTQSTPAPGVPGPSTTGTSAPAAPGSAGVPPTSPPGSAGTEPGVSNNNPEAQRHAQEAAEARLRLKAAEKELAQLKASTQTESERAVAAAREEGAKVYREKWASSLAQNAALAVLAERRVIATELALRGLELSNVDVNLETGIVDTAEIVRRVDALIARYPMLVPEGLPPVGSVNGGDQRRIQASQLVRPSTDNSPEALNKALRYALGARDE